MRQSRKKGGRGREEGKSGGHSPNTCQAMPSSKSSGVGGERLEMGGGGRSLFFRLTSLFSANASKTHFHQERPCGALGV